MVAPRDEVVVESPEDDDSPDEVREPDEDVESLENTRPRRYVDPLVGSVPSENERRELDVGSRPDVVVREDTMALEDALRSGPDNVRPRRRVGDGSLKLEVPTARVVTDAPAPSARPVATETVTPESASRTRRVASDSRLVGVLDRELVLVVPDDSTARVRSTSP